MSKKTLKSQDYFEENKLWKWSGIDLWFNFPYKALKGGNQRPTQESQLATYLNSRWEQEGKQ